MGGGIGGGAHRGSGGWREVIIRAEGMGSSYYYSYFYYYYYYYYYY